MRLGKDLRGLLRVGSRRGYQSVPTRPGRRARRGRYLAAGAMAPAGTPERRFALELVREEIRAGTYVSGWRLSAALDRLLAAML
jgi:hypothetical protein